MDRSPETWDQTGIKVGDILEARVERGKITFSAKSAVDRAIAEGLEDIRKGRARQLEVLRKAPTDA